MTLGITTLRRMAQIIITLDSTLTELYSGISSMGFSMMALGITLLNEMTFGHNKNVLTSVVI
jgi:hypothetical protein